MPEVGGFGFATGGWGHFQPYTVFLDPPLILNRYQSVEIFSWAQELNLNCVSVEETSFFNNL